MSNKYERELWNFITKGDWENVVTFLRNAKQDPERRKDEADLVIKSEEYKPVLQKTKLNLDDVNRSRS